MNLKIIVVFIALANCCYGKSEKAKELYALGVKQNQVGKLNDASVLFTQALAEEPWYADAFYQRGMSFYGMRELDSAVSDFKQAIELKVKSVNAYTTLIQIYRNGKQYEKALEVTIAILKELPDNALGAYYTQGQIHEEAGDYPKSLNAYRSAERIAFRENPKFAERLERRIASVLTKTRGR